MTDRQTWHKNGLSIVEQNKRLEKNYILVQKKKMGKGCQQRQEMVFSFFFVNVLEIRKLQIYAAIYWQMISRKKISLARTVWKSTMKRDHAKKIRKINSLVKTLIWRKKCRFFRRNCDRLLVVISTLWHTVW